MAHVSHQHGFNYLKTEKTGGPSVEMALPTLCTPAGTEVSQCGPAMVTDLGILGAPDDTFISADRTGWKSHMPAKRGARSWFLARNHNSLDAPTADILRRNWGWIFEAGEYSPNPADAGRASRGAGRQVRAPDIAARVDRPEAPEGGLAARVKHLLTRRGRMRAVLIPALLGLVQPVAAQTADEQAALGVAREICAAGPTEIDAALSALVAAGWTENEVALQRALASAMFASRFDTGESGFSALDSFFMVGQVLGNSALGPNQLGFDLGDLSLAVLGIEEGMPYCLVAGPGWLVDAASAGVETKIVPGYHQRGDDHPVIAREGRIGSAAYADLRIDLAAAARFDPITGTERTAGSRMSRDDYEELFATVFREGNIHITSEAALQEN